MVLELISSNFSSNANVCLWNTCGKHNLDFTVGWQSSEL